MRLVRSLAGSALACAALGCDRTEQLSAGAVADSAAEDTVVRRVFRQSRSASAIQRVTGPIATTRALRPLDSVLTVRILDARGAELGGVPVRWSLRRPADGAELRVINAVTDSLGLSRAALTPGRSADPQAAVANVPNVGEIPFSVTIPVASARVVPDTFTVWTGDSVLVKAEMLDAEGTPLVGGAVVWRADDMNVLRLSRVDETSVYVIGALAGRTTLSAWTTTGTTRASARVRVRGGILGRFIPMDGGRPPDMTLEIRAPGLRDSVPVRNGAFSRRFDVPDGADVVLQASPRGSAIAYHDVELSVGTPRQLQDLTIALVPRTFRIEGGTWDGAVVAIDAGLAMRRTARTASFWRLVPISGRGPRKLLGWSEADFPLRIAFDRAGSRESISAADSTAFWTIAGQMQRDLGRPVFVPAEMSADVADVANVAAEGAPVMRASMRSDTGAHSPRSFVRVQIRTRSSEGHTFVSWTQTGDAMEGALQFSRASTLRDAHVVTHELTHLLGFGHSTAWPSVSQPSSGTELRLTREDVAYMQLAMKLRRLQQETGARPGLP